MHAAGDRRRSSARPRCRSSAGCSACVTTTSERGKRPLDRIGRVGIGRIGEFGIGLDVGFGFGFDLLDFRGGPGRGGCVHRRLLFQFVEFLFHQSQLLLQQGDFSILVTGGLGLRLRCQYAGQPDRGRRRQRFLRRFPGHGIPLCCRAMKRRPFLSPPDDGSVGTIFDRDRKFLIQSRYFPRRDVAMSAGVGRPNVPPRTDAMYRLPIERG